MASKVRASPSLAHIKPQLRPCLTLLLRVINLLPSALCLHPPPHPSHFCSHKVTLLFPISSPSLTSLSLPTSSPPAILLCICSHQVTLLFVEPLFTSAGLRVMSVTVNGVFLISLDLVTVCGGALITCVWRFAVNLVRGWGVLWVLVQGVGVGSGVQGMQGVQGCSVGGTGPMHTYFSPMCLYIRHLITTMLREAPVSLS